MKDKIKAARWSLSLAWHYNKSMLIILPLIVSIVSILPALAVQYNKAIITELNSFLSTDTGVFDDILPVIIMFGIITALIGLSNRVNNDLIYTIMFDHYYFGMQEVLMDSIQGFSMEELLKKDAKDEYYAVFDRPGSLTEFISGFCTLLGKFIGIVSLLIVAFSLSTLVFVVSLAYIIGITWHNLNFSKKLHSSWYKIRDKQRLAAHYEEMPYSQEYAKELRIFESKNMLIKNWQEAYTSIYNYQVKKGFMTELHTFISSFGFYIFLTAIIFYAIFAVAGGAMTAAILLVIFTLCLSIFDYIANITRSLMFASEGLYALERQYKIFGKRPKPALSSANVEDKTVKTAVVFEARNLSYAYKEGELALNDVSFSIKRGETIALVGANGSGKSTLIKLLLQLYKPLSGNLLYFGQDYDTIEKGFLKNQIGAFFQDYHLFHMPIAENIGFGDIGNVHNQDKINLALEKGGASAFVSKLPKGSNTYIYRTVEESGAVFSGGETQKLAVSRAHMSDKDILIFDEPASMLDPIAELEQFMHIKDKLAGRTAILISHRVGFARLADRVILLANGQIAETGIHDELMKKNGLYANLFNEQAQWYQNGEEAISERG